MNFNPDNFYSCFWGNVFNRIFRSLKKKKNRNIHFDKVASFPRLFNNLDQDDPPQQPTPGDHLENYFPENKKGSPPLIKPMFDEFKSRGITTGRSRKRINRSSVQPSPRSPAQDYQGMKSDRSASRIPPKGFEHENDTFASIPNRDTPFPEYLSSVWCRIDPSKNRANWRDRWQSRGGPGLRITSASGPPPRQLRLIFLGQSFRSICSDVD